ncbi:MAG: hypothetical protein QXP53_02525 [Candidatus Pacearchaeota archaeon]
MLNKKLVSLFIFVIFTLILFSVVDAKIVFTKPSKTYNLGDKIAQSVSLAVNEDFDGFLKVTLNCAEKEFLVYYAPIKLKKDETKNIDLSFNFNSTGLCKFVASTEKDNAVIETAVSDEFLISDAINFELGLNKAFFMPKDKFEVKGKIYKKSGALFTGIANLVVFNKNFSVSVDKGNFVFSSEVPEDVKPGSNLFYVEVLDDLGNKGSATLNFSVASVPSSLIIEINNESIMPGSMITITPKLIDQYNTTLPENVSLRLFRREDKFLTLERKTLLLEEFLVSGNSTNFQFDLFASPGDYLITAYSEGFKAEKIVVMPLVEKIEVNLSNGTLIARNVGNVPYNKPLNMKLNFGNSSKSLILDLNLRVNETQTFRIQAPKGTYNVSFDFLSSVEQFSDVALSGDVVAAIELDKSGQEARKSYLWLVILVIVVCLVYLLRKRIHLKSYLESIFHFKKRKRYVKFSYADDSGKKRAEQAIQEKQKEFKVKESEDKMVSRYVEPNKIKGQSPSSVPPSQLFYGRKQADEENHLKKIFLKHASRLNACHIETAKLIGVSRQEVSLAFVKVHGLNELENLKKKSTAMFERITTNFFDGITRIIKGYGGIADLHNNKLIIFFPEQGKELYLIKTLNEIKAFTEKFNRELTKEAGFELAVSSGAHSGLIAFTVDKGIARVSSDETLKISEALANKAFKNEILLSMPLYMKIASVIKAKRITPLYVDEKRAIETFLLQHPAPSQIREEGKSRVRQFLDKIS